MKSSTYSKEKHTNKVIRRHFGVTSEIANVNSDPEANNVTSLNYVNDTPLVESIITPKLSYPEGTQSYQITNSNKHHIISSSNEMISNHSASNKAVPVKHYILDVIFQYKYINEKINRDLKIIHNSIVTIKNVEAMHYTDYNAILLFDTEIDAYFDLHTCLVTLNQKINLMLNEKHLSHERSNKIATLLTILAKITASVSEFMRPGKMGRSEMAMCLYQDIIQELSSSETSALIDDHKDNFWKWGNSVCGIGFFSTDSRKKLTSIKTACSNIVQLLTTEEEQAVLKTYF